VAVFQRLPDMLRRLDRLEKRVNAANESGKAGQE
jgi:hypothetical protein